MKIIILLLKFIFKANLFYRYALRKFCFVSKAENNSVLWCGHSKAPNINLTCRRILKLFDNICFYFCLDKTKLSWRPLYFLSLKFPIVLSGPPVCTSWLNVLVIKFVSVLAFSSLHLKLVSYFSHSQWSQFYRAKIFLEDEDVWVLGKMSVLVTSNCLSNRQVYHVKLPGTRQWNRQ